MQKIIATSLFAILIGCDLPQAEKQPTDILVTEVVDNVPKVLESEPVMIENCKKEWEAVVLTKAEDYNMQIKGFPKYETYLSDLDKILEKISSITQANIETYPKLEKLRLKLIDSKKYKDALKNYLIYGQPIERSEITGPCERYLENNLNDPSSLDIVDTDFDGQSKNGWIVWIKYRAKNGFGATVLEVAKYEVQYNPTDKVYGVIKAF